MQLAGQVSEILHPQLIGVPMLSVSRAIDQDLFGFSKKSGLEYAIASYTTVQIAGSKQLADGSEVFELIVQQPLLKGTWNEDELATRKAMHKWIEGSGESNMVAYPMRLAVRPTGLGWTTEWVTPVLSPVQLQKEVATHPDRFQHPHVAFPINGNPFGAREMMYRFSFATAILMIFVSGLMATAMKKVAPFAVGSLAGFIMMAGPSAITYLGG